MKMNNRFLYGIISIVIAALIAFIAIPTVNRNNNSRAKIVRVTANIARGEQLTTKNVELVEVGGYNLPEEIITNLEEAIGAYSKIELMIGDSVLSNKISVNPVSSDLTLNTIPTGKVAISITTQTLASALSDKLQAGDIVRLFHYNNQAESLNRVSTIPELQFVKVLSVTDSGGNDLDYSTPPSEEEEKQHTTTVTVLASPEQAMLLTQYENEGILNFAFLSRVDE